MRDGLGDREPSVRVAAGKVVCAWFDFVSAEGERLNGKDEEVGWEGDDAGVMKSLMSFLGLFDVLGRGGPGEGEAVAIDAVLSIFTTRREVLDCFLFDGLSSYLVFLHSLTLLQRHLLYPGQYIS